MPALAISLTQPLRDVRITAQPGSIGNSSSLEDVEKAAFERGRAEAEKNLREQLMQQRAELASVQAGVLKSLRDAVSQVVQQSEILLVDLALDVAQKLVAGMPITREMVAAGVQEALDQIDSTTEITVQLHPDDLVIFEQIPPPDRPGASSMDCIRLAGSPLVERGGCVVHTRFGIIDTQRHTKIRTLKSALAS